MAPGGLEEGGGGLLPPKEPVALYAALGMPVLSTEQLSDARHVALS